MKHVMNPFYCTICKVQSLKRIDIHIAPLVVVSSVGTFSLLGCLVGVDWCCLVYLLGCLVGVVVLFVAWY